MGHASHRCSKCRTSFNDLLRCCPACQAPAKPRKETHRAPTRTDIAHAIPQPIVTLLEEASQLAGAGNTLKAVEIYLEATKRVPTHPDAWRELGVGYAILKQFDRSLECNEQAMHLDPHDARHWDHKAVTLGRMGNFAAGLKVLEEATTKLPGSAVLRMRLGYFLSRLSRHQESLKAFHQAQTLDPDDPTIPLLRSQPEKELGFSDEARSSLEDALAIARRMDLLPSYAKQIRILLRHLEEPAWEHDPVSALYAAQNAADAWAQGDLDHALQCFMSAVSFDPIDPSHWCNAGACARQLSRWEDAAQFYQRADELLPHFCEILIGLGHSRKMLCQWDGALSSFSELIELEGENVDHWRDTAYILQEMKRYDEALRHYDMAIRLDPDDRNIWLEKSLVLDSLGRKEDANDLRLEAFSDPDFEEQWMKAGAVPVDDIPPTLH